MKWFHSKRQYLVPVFFGVLPSNFFLSLSTYEYFKFTDCFLDLVVVERFKNNMYVIRINC